MRKCWKSIVQSGNNRKTIMIEDLIGIDLFAELDDNIENQLEEFFKIDLRL